MVQVVFALVELSVKMKFLNYCLIFSLGILLFFSFSLYADSNGVWINSEDVRAGFFGFDELNSSFNYTFLNPVEINNTLTTNFFNIVNDPINDSNLISVKQVEDSLFNIINCGKDGLIFNGSNCIYVSGANLSINSFTFNSATSAEFDTFVISNSITINGIINRLVFEIEDNETYATIIKNNVNTNSRSVIVSNGDVIKLRMKSLNDFELTSRVNVAVGNYLTTWSVKTKADKIQVILNSNLMNFNLDFNQNPTGAQDYEVIINSGVRIGSASASLPAFTTGNLPSGSTVTIINNGEIRGAGGNGGYHGAPYGQKGGTAIEILVPTSIENNWLIYSGGGGGGTTNYNGGYFQDHSGGGGAGLNPGLGGAGRGHNWGDGWGGWSAGANGGLEIGGAGGTGPSVGGNVCGGYGGGVGFDGNRGCRGAATEGKAGSLVKTNSNSLTWIKQGTTLGPVEN